MLALSVTDIKDFMNQLLIGETFDHFSLIEASIVTFNTFTIDGKLQKDFFDTDTLEAFTENAMEYSLWQDVKPFCFSVIRGKRTPVSFKIVFRLPLKKMQAMLEQAIPDFSSDVLGGLYLNLQYKNKALLCTTGLSFRSFMPDKRPEQLWDSIISDFLRKHGISFEQM